MLTISRRALPAGTRAFGASPWGSDAWRYDKDAFKHWTAAAMKNADSKEGRELYGYLAMSFGDVDVDKDGKISVPEFDRLCEQVASLPRRFGLAPSWQVSFQNSVTKRTEARETMFNAITGGEQRMGLDEWMQFANNHITKKIPTIDFKAVDFAHLDKNNKDAFVAYITQGVTDDKSIAHASLYNFLLTLFTECDLDGKGKINFEQFDTLATAAAKVPRFYGLAPEGNAQATRKEIFDDISQHDGYVTFGDFVQWVFKHTRVMLKNPTAKATAKA